MDALDDRREYPRVPLDVEVTVLSVGRSRNISVGGVCIVFLERYERGTVLDLSFRLPHTDRPLRVGGRIAWVDEFSLGGEVAYDTGIEFVEIAPEDVEAIKAHIRRTMAPSVAAHSAN